MPPRLPDPSLVLAFIPKLDVATQDAKCTVETGNSLTWMIIVLQDFKLHVRSHIGDTSYYARVPYKPPQARRPEPLPPSGAGSSRYDYDSLITRGGSGGGGGLDDSPRPGLCVVSSSKGNRKPGFRFLE